MYLQRFLLGPMENATYLLSGAEGDAVLVDPTFEMDEVWEHLTARSLTLQQIWLTHAHFDHIAGCAVLDQAVPGLPIYLHPADMSLWTQAGLAGGFGIELPLPQTEPLPLSDGQMLEAGDITAVVRHTPGHSPGHVVFQLPALNCVLTGDLIFRDGIGRSDLPGGDGDVLQRSIAEHILTLPADTILYPGHGLETTVGREKQHNPWLS